MNMILLRTDGTPAVYELRNATIAHIERDRGGWSGEYRVLYPVWAPHLQGGDDGWHGPGHFPFCEYIGRPA